jgi:hypothetical protein
MHKRTGQVWRVRCSCGVDFDRSVAALLSHEKRRPGTRCFDCSAKLKAGQANEDARTLFRVGDEIGLFTLVRFVRMARGGQLWLVRCRCGAELLRSPSSIATQARKHPDTACRSCSARARQLRGVPRRAGLKGIAGRYGFHHASIAVELNGQGIDTLDDSEPPRELVRIRLEGDDW